MKLAHAAAALLLAVGLAGCKAHSNPNFGGSGRAGGQVGGAQEQDRARDACCQTAGRERMRVLRVLDTRTLREDGKVVGADVTMRVQRKGDDYTARCRHTASTGSVSLKRV